ncbi:MAG: alpha/beta hydrolase [Methyloligellaceae bacterium]
MSIVDQNEQYDVEAMVPNLPEIMARYATLSGPAADLPGAHLDLAYGDGPRQKLDIFPPTDGAAPALLFFHGGYWRAGTKEDRRFPAAPWRERGVAWVPVEYRLAPEVSLDDIVDDARAAVAWFHRNAARFGCDPDRITVAGSSAGGHITGMLAAEGWQDRYGVPDDVIKAGCAISGLFDLEPLRHTFVNEWLALDSEAAERNSPLWHFPRQEHPLLIAWGGKESIAFKRQSQAYAQACLSSGVQVQTLERETADHFSIIGEIGQADSPLFAAIAAQIGLP